MRRFKVLIEQKGGGEGGKSNESKSDPFVRETRNKTAWHQSPPRDTRTRTHTHTPMLSAFSLTHTHTLSDYWAVAATPLTVTVRETQNMRTKSSTWEEQQGINR